MNKCKHCSPKHAMLMASSMDTTQPGGVAHCKCAAVEEEDIRALAVQRQERDTAAPTLKHLQRAVAVGQGPVVETRLLLCIPQTNRPAYTMNTTEML